MKTKILAICMLFAAFLLSANAPSTGKITVFTIGDSTMANKDTTIGDPERGWAMMFQQFFNDNVVVENHARNGRSTKSFFDEGLWKTVLDQLTPGDYVFIQFGHNDQKNEDPRRYTDPDGSFRDFLTMYVNETRAKGAHPVLLTQVARRKFEGETPVNTLGDYVQAVRELARQLGVPLIDVEQQTRALLQRSGPEDSKEFYMWLNPGDSPKHPQGLQDDTHLNGLGATRVAEMVVNSMRRARLPLAEHVKPRIQDLNWASVAMRQPEAWYGSQEAKNIAENVLLYQRNIGGWPKNTPMHNTLSENEKKRVLADKTNINDVTIDNDALFLEMNFLARMYHQTRDETYKNAFLNGLNYLLEAQYPNGGWPQYYPLQPGYGGYFTRITFNDEAMINMMNILKKISERDELFTLVDDPALIQKCAEALQRGIDVTLQMQYRQNGTLTTWCAQHDEHTLLPTSARTYELPSLSGAEGAEVVMFLMEFDNPTPEMKQAINAAAAWYERVKVFGIRVESFVDENGSNDRRVVQDPSAPPIWGRFHDLETNQPFFTGRDGIKKNSLAEIERERRSGYNYYATTPRRMLELYAEWSEKHNR
ncbi:MAG: pectate lyase [Bacteroidales bacterium]|nr:pectate lyase [Bacteroidales bacterium]